MEFTISFYLVILVPLVCSQSQYVHYLINCGSNYDFDFNGQVFIGDNNDTNFSVSGGDKAVNNNPASNTLEIYRTARVFTQKSWYQLQAVENDHFAMVRLHFSPFLTNGFELSNSIFDVSVSGFSLLSNFNVRDSTVIKEFIIPIIWEGNLRIVFTPSKRSSRAFVNAIEAFTISYQLFRQGVLTTHISPAGKRGDIYNISSSYAFSPIYRINVGGPNIDVDRDTLRRNWIPDDEYMFNNEPAKTPNPLQGTLGHKESLATIYDAPDDVYKTAKQLNDLSANLTWKFTVNKNAMFLVRAHFCDIITQGLNDDAFNFFIYSHYNEPINPGEKFNFNTVDSTFLNVSIGAKPGTYQPVFLNGLEIMELLTSSGVVGIPNDGKSNKKVCIEVGCAVGGVAFVLLVGFFIRIKYRKTKAAVPAPHSYTSITGDFNVNNLSPIPKLNLNLRFQLVDILQVTNGFDENLVIGKGGFGKVYRGTFADGKIVAVKRGEKGHGQGRPEFVTEIMVLSKIRHKHLVALIGYCDEKSEMILVYEFMGKGTLQDHLYDTNKDIEKLSWNQRLDICISATRGLDYLHTGSDAGIIHRDVKSTNILLDENYVAKVADFGISRLDNVDESEMDIKGSFGYLDPEYISCLKLTQKSDVYSFGVVLLEVLCARPALDATLPSDQANLASWANNQIKGGMVEKIIDPFLLGKINLNSLRMFLGTVEKCLKNTGDERPSMRDVLWDLEYALRLQQMVVDKELYEDSTMNTSMRLSMSVIDRLPSKSNDDDSRVNDSSVSSYPSESQVFSQLKIDEAR